MNKLEKYYKELVIVVSTMFFGLCSYAYIFLNGIFSHDAARILQNDYPYQISLGRYIQPLYFFIRGNLQVPWLIGVLTLIYLSIAIIFINKVFKFKKTSSLILLSGLLTVNITLILACASYMPWVDVYMFCFMLCSISLYLFTKNKTINKVLSCLLIVIMLGMYQSYFSVILTLFLIYCIYLLLNGNKTKDVIILGLKALGILIAALIIYYGILMIVLNVTNVDLASGNNSISGVGNYTSVNFVKLLVDTYIYPFTYYINPNTFNRRLIKIINVIVLVITTWGLIKIIKNNQIKRNELVLVIILLLLLPLCINAIYFISKGIVHELVIYSFNMVYLLTLLIFDMNDHKILDKATIVSLTVIILCNVVYANQTYLKKDLEFKATQSLCTRIMDRVEQLEGYKIGITPVTFIGDLNKSPVEYERFGFEHIGGVGITDQGTYSITYDLTAPWFFNEVMGFNINYVEPYEYMELEEVKSMPAFPEKGSIKRVNNVVVIKLSY